MSSMNKIAWTYTDDQGNTYRRNASKAITDQVGTSTDPKVGGASGAAVDAELPKYLTPRRVIVQNGSNIRQVVCYHKDAELYDGTETTITLEIGGADVSCTVIGWEGERMRHRRTRQTA